MSSVAEILKQAWEKQIIIGLDNYCCSQVRYLIATNIELKDYQTMLIELLDTGNLENSLMALEMARSIIFNSNRDGKEI